MIVYITDWISKGNSFLNLNYIKFMLIIYDVDSDDDNIDC